MKRICKKCKKCKKEKEITDFARNRHKCKKCIQGEWTEKYHSDENFRKSINNHNNLNRIKNKDKRNKYEKNRRKNDIKYRLKINLRNRISEILNNKKRDKSINLLGCTLGFFKDYIESKFQPGMTWENYGYEGWHIDHIKPCALFNLTDPEQQKICFNYTNLQPLWKKDNLRKSNKL